MTDLSAIFSSLTGLWTCIGSMASMSEWRDSDEARGITPHAHESMGGGTGATAKMSIQPYH